jgi:UDP-N-acetylglucosamine acyltransferase
MAIHPTAVVEAGAVIDASCTVGPYAVIGPRVRLGEGSSVGSHAVVTGNTTLGRQNRVFPHAVIGEIPQDLKFRGEDSRLEIGDGNTFREFSTVNLGTEGGGGVTRIGNGGLFMAYSHVGHDCIIGDGAIIANGVALAGHIVIEDHVHVSGLAAAHQFVQLGRLSFVSGLTGVAMDVAPYCTVAGARAELAGLNLVGLQRAGMSEEQIARVKQAYKVFFRSGLPAAEALGQLRAELGGHPEIAHFIAFVERSKRGITR